MRWLSYHIYRVDEKQLPWIINTPLTLLIRKQLRSLGEYILLYSEALVAAGANIFDYYADSMAALMLVSFYGQVEAVEYVLSLGVYVNEINTLHYTALGLATEWNHVEVMKHLLSHGADVNLGNDDTRRIMLANNRDAIDLLVRHGAELNFKVDEYSIYSI